MTVFMTVVFTLFVFGVLVCVTVGAAIIDTESDEKKKEGGRRVVAFAPVWPLFVVYQWASVFWHVVGPSVRSALLPREKSGQKRQAGPYRTAEEEQCE